MTETARLLDLPDMDGEAWYEFAEQHGWGDGLPMLVPTVEAVDAFLAGAGNHHEPFSAIPPAGIVPDIRSIAANAVMAGCKPSSFGVVVAALRAVLTEEFNAVGVMATTHPCTPLVLVSGSARATAGINSGYNCFGQGSRANATIGRALHLVLVNLGGSVPGRLDRATHGSPAKYSYCFAEDEDACPWEPFAVRRGFDPGQPVATVFAAEAPHNVNDHGSTTGDEILLTIAGTMAVPGSNNIYLGGEHVVVLGPEHAATLAGDGWDVPRIQDRLYELARVPAAMVSTGKQAEFSSKGAQHADGHYRLAGGPQSIQIVVAGGSGKHSMWIPTFGSSRCVSSAIGRPEPEGENHV